MHETSELMKLYHGEQVHFPHLYIAYCSYIASYMCRIKSIQIASHMQELGMSLIWSKV